MEDSKAQIRLYSTKDEEKKKKILTVTNKSTATSFTYHCVYYKAT
jgi:hypothetical protein